MYIGNPSKPTTTLQTVMENSVAQKAGIKSGDKITEINGVNIKSWNELSKEIQSSNGKELSITINRDGKEKNVKVKPELKDGNYLIGISPKNKKIY